VQKIRICNTFTILSKSRQSVTYLVLTNCQMNPQGFLMSVIIDSTDPRSEEVSF
jgi:hypothetical protein